MNASLRFRTSSVLALCIMALHTLPAQAEQPYSGVTLDFHADDTDFLDDREGSVTLLLFPDLAIEQARVRFEVEYGDAQVVDPVGVELGTLTPGESYVVDAMIRLTGLGKVSIRADITGVYADSQREYGESKVLYLVSSGESIESGTIDFMPLQLELLQRSRLKGLLTKSSYEAERRQVLYGGATTDARIERGIETKGLATITVRGMIFWTDVSGNTHDANLVVVELHDANGTDNPIAVTNASLRGGVYSFFGVTGLAEGRDLFIRAKSTSSAVSVKATIPRDPYAIDSETMTGIMPGDSLTLDLTANNVAANNRAFAVHEGLIRAAEYVGKFATLPPVPALFPVANDDFRAAAFGLPTHINLTNSNWAFWDVSGHEYAHYYQHELMLSASPGGQHSIFENLAERLGKDNGTKLAWGEGYATYLAISGQVANALSDLGIDGVGDTVWSRANSSGSTARISLESGAVISSKGEDNELAVARILWDLHDQISDSGDGIGLTDVGVNDIIVNSKPTTLSTFWAALTASATPTDIDAYGKIFAEHKVAPKTVSVTPPANSTPPKLAWEAQGGGPSFQNNKFFVKFYTHDLAELIFTSPETVFTDYTPSTSDWNSITSRGPLVKWNVEGSNRSPSETGPYQSFAQTIGTAALAFVIDDTESMREEIEGVKAAFEEFIVALPAIGGPIINLITFKDDVVSRLVSNDPTELRTAVQALSATGGDDCPEASIEALSLAGDHIEGGGRILFATDADGHFGASVRVAILKLLARGIRVDVLLTGSCDGSLKTAGACNTQDCIDNFQISKTPADCLEPECFDLIPPDAEPFSVEAVTAYSAIAAATGGVFATIPEVNLADPTSFFNIATNVMFGLIQPSITDSNPRVVFQGATMDIVLTGASTNFNETSQVFAAGTDITVNSTETLSPTSLRVNLTLANDAALTFRDLTVTTSFGKGTAVEMATGVGVIEVEMPPPTPVIVGTFPSVGIRGETLDVTVSGVNTHFDDTSRFTIGPLRDEFTVNSFTALSATEGVANITIPDDADLGTQPVKVFTASISEGTTEAFPVSFVTVDGALLGSIVRITSVTPPVSPPGTTVTLTLTGQNTTFQDGVTTVAISGDGISVGTVLVASATTLTVDIIIDPTAPFGFRDLFVTTGDETASALNGFQVGAGPPIANAGADQLVVSTGPSVSVTLDGSMSSVSEGSIAAFHWSGTPDPNDVEMPTLSLAPGEHTFSLVIEDDSGVMSEPDEVVITVNGAPVADAGTDIEVEAENGMATVTLDGTASADPSKSIVSFVWTGSPDPDDVASPTLTLSLGEYVFTLVVMDDQGATSASDTVRVSVVTQATPPPEPQCGAGPTELSRAGRLGDLMLLFTLILILSAQSRNPSTTRVTTSDR